MSKLSVGNKLQLIYIEKLFDEKLLVVGERLKTIEYKIITLTETINGNSENSLVNKVNRSEKWINEMTGKIAIISVIVGSVVTILISFVKNIFASPK